MKFNLKQIIEHEYFDLIHLLPLTLFITILIWILDKQSLSIGSVILLFQMGCSAIYLLRKYFREVDEK